MKIERFTAWRWLPYLILLIAPIAGHIVAFATGLTANPMILNAGVSFGGGGSIITGASYSDGNLGVTNQALGHLAAEQWLHGIVPWWNPYSGIGLPLAGEMQPAALFLPFVLLLIFHDGLIWLIWVMQALAGIACYLLLLKLGLRRSIALVGGLLFLYSGTFSWKPGETILNVIPFLPVLLLGIEMARTSSERTGAILLVAIGIGWSLLGGFPEAAFIDGLLALLWALVRWRGVGTPSSYLLRIAAGGVLGLLIALPAIVSFLDFAAQSLIFEHHRLGSTFIPVRGLSVVFMPYIYGPLGNSYGNLAIFQIGASTAGYVGAMIMPFAALGLVSRRAPLLQAMLATWFVLCMAKTFGFAPVLDAMNAIPFVNEIMFQRYSSASWELAIIVLAMFGLEDVWLGCVGRLKWRIAMATGLASVVLSVALAWPWAPVWHWQGPDFHMVLRWFLVDIGFVSAGFLALWVIHSWAPDRWRHLAFGAALVINAFVLFSVPQLSGQKPGTVDRRAIAFLRDNLGLSRFYTIGPFAPNYSAYFDIRNINDNYLPVAKNWGDYIGKYLYPDAAIYNGNIFWPPFPPLSMQNAADDVVRFADHYRDVGVKYILTPPGLSLQRSLVVPPHPGNAAALALYNGDWVTLSAKAPATIGDFSPVGRIGVDIATYNGSAGGTLRLKLCAGSVCASGSGSLRDAADNAPLWVSLNHPVALDAGEPFTLTAVHENGGQPNAVWMYPGDAANGTLSTNRPQSVRGRTIQVLFARGLAGSGLSKVYHDPILDIWHLAGTKPYYSVLSGKCTLSFMRQQSVTADCAGPARLVRRELFMPGWHARIGTRRITIEPVDGIMQGIALPAGRSTVRFWFVPPFIGYAWAGFWFAVIVLMLEIVRCMKGRPAGLQER